MLIELTSEQSISNYKDGPQQRMCAFILNYSCLPIGEKTWYHMHAVLLPLLKVGDSEKKFAVTKSCPSDID